ncbi:MAG: glycosyltransferase family 4 protein [Acidobacteria bacterium]|nr:glycosyltransferase family 4 protein [Acidobacteriota bacterium]
MTTAAVLMLVRDPRGAERALPGLLPGRSLLPIRREEVAGLRPLALLSYLRSLRAEEFIVLTDEIERHERLIRLQALGALAPAPRSLLLDLRGRLLPLSPGRFLARDLPLYLLGVAASASVLLRTAARVRRLRRLARHAPRPAGGRRVCYFRSDLWGGVRAGGSVAHTAGVAAGFRAAGADLFFISTYPPALVDPARHAVHLVPPDGLYNVGREVPYFAHSLRFERSAARVLAERPADLIYQRFDAGNHAGVVLSRRLGVPLVLEYNGSEVWIADHWDRSFRWRSLFVGLEEVNLRHADLIVVVSEALRETLLSRGVEPERIVVQPNGVDPERYRPDLDGGAVRRKFGVEGRTVVGFIGIFGAWHGAPVLARAAVRVLAGRPEVRFLFVGDGVQRREAEAILQSAGCARGAAFAGVVPQEEGPAHLAAMDVLVAPHVRNPDGTPFFGSPTKLFEYMAMGRGIVASRLGQIGDVLEDGRTSLLVPPGDAETLARAIIRLVDDVPLRDRLGAAARRRALERHTWETGVRRLIDRLLVGGLVRWS